MSGIPQRRHLYGGLLIVAALMSASCDSASLPPSTFAVRDSAGVQILESTAPAWAPDEAWVVGAEPAVQIGVIDGSEEYQFTTIVAAWRVPDGGFVVADRRSAEFRLFDAGGMFRAAFGGLGDGPGEFRYLGVAYPYRGDSIIGGGYYPGAYSVFDGDGRFGRSLTLSNWSRGGFNGVFPDGSLLMAPATPFQENPGGRMFRETILLRYSADGDSRQSLGTFPGPEYLAPVGDRNVSDALSRQVVRVPDGAGLYVGSSGGFEVQHFQSDGVLDRVIRSSHRNLALTQEHRDAFEASQRERLAESRSPQEIERALESVEFPETVPPYSQLLVDSEDHLWVRDYKILGTSGPEVWSVFTPEGQLLGTLQTPERLDVRQIGVDFILGIWMDELDVMYVRMYTLRRGRV